MVHRIYRFQQYWLILKRRCCLLQLFLLLRFHSPEFVLLQSLVYVAEGKPFV